MNTEPAIFPDIDAYIKMGEENPELFAKIIADYTDKIGIKIRKESKIKGLSITYRDRDAYPGCLIQEEADGRRFIIRLNPEKNYCTEIVREIPAKQEK